MSNELKKDPQKKENQKPSDELVNSADTSAREVENSDLDKVVGGSSVLSKACTVGKHFNNAKIEVSS